MKDSFSESYKQAGVDVTAGYESVELMKDSVKRTHTSEVLGGIGGFGGLLAPNLTGMKEPVLVSGTDGVGTKIKLAFLLDKHDTVGIDCVAMCVNDVICCGARPMLFLDYIATGKNFPEKIATIVSGVAEGCVQAGCALIGGETAEHPGLMPEDEYDLAGFTVGVVDKEKILDVTAQKPGDVLIALASSGVHSNGFSLVRKVLDVEHADLTAPVEELGGKGLGEVLLTPTKIYVKAAGRGEGEGHRPHHRRRLLRKYSPCHRPRPLRQDQPGRCAGAAHLRLHRQEGQHPGAGYVQHLQHGCGHDRLRGAGRRRQNH